MNQSSQICLHLLCHDVDIFIVSLMRRFLNIYQLHDILMFKKLYKINASNIAYLIFLFL